MAKDPVCGMTVKEETAAGKSVYQGKTYHFCAPGCKAAFDRNPEKYVEVNTGQQGMNGVRSCCH